MKRERLVELLHQLRAMLAAEVPIRLHRATPIDDDSFSHSVGIPFTAAFSRYIGHPDGWGQSRPGMASILEVSEWCHGRHTSHEIPGQTRSLCAQLVYEVAYLGERTEVVAQRHTLGQTTTEAMLYNALNHAASWWGRREKLEPDYDGPEPIGYERLLKTA